MGIELKLGSEFYAGETKLVVVKGEGCEGCFFSDKHECGGLECQADCRKDETAVIFVESNLPDVSNLPAPPKTEDKEIKPTESIKNDIFDNKVRMDLLPWPELEEVAKVYTVVAKKYGENKWQDLPDGYACYKGAMLRHLTEIEKGNEIDNETGCMHTAQVAWNAIAMLHFRMKNKENK